MNQLLSRVVRNRVKALFLDLWKERWFYQFLLLFLVIKPCSFTGYLYPFFVPLLAGGWLLEVAEAGRPAIWSFRERVSWSRRSSKQIILWIILSGIGFVAGWPVLFHILLVPFIFFIFFFLEARNELSDYFAGVKFLTLLIMPRSAIAGWIRLTVLGCWLVSAFIGYQLLFIVESVLYPWWARLVCAVGSLSIVTPLVVLACSFVYSFVSVYYYSAIYGLAAGSNKKD
ncbi:MAG: hypothetical protein JW725_02365 [Candidatus Babeliaceae bacterium]|nr:hypothetical protein [Candidatus Babeliaceae bacterium]